MLPRSRDGGVLVARWPDGTVAFRLGPPVFILKRPGAGKREDRELLFEWSWLGDGESAFASHWRADEADRTRPDPDETGKTRWLLSRIGVIDRLHSPIFLLPHSIQDFEVLSLFPFPEAPTVRATDEMRRRARGIDLLHPRPTTRADVSSLLDAPSKRPDFSGDPLSGWLSVGVDPTGRLWRLGSTVGAETVDAPTVSAALEEILSPRGFAGNVFIDEADVEAWFAERTIPGEMLIPESLVEIYPLLGERHPAAWPEDRWRDWLDRTGL